MKCSMCNGTGQIVVGSTERHGCAESRRIYDTCPRCKGTGKKLFGQSQKH